MFRIVVPFVLCTYSVKGQHITSPEEAWPYLIANHPLIKNDRLEVQKEELKISGLGHWQPLSVQYQGGQINYPGYDQFITVEQNISPLIHKKLIRSQKQTIRLNAAALRNQNRLTIHGLKRDLQMLFNDWQYWHTRESLQDSILILLHQIEPIIQLHFEQGQIDGVEYELFQEEITDSENKKTLLTEHKAAAENRIRRMLYVSDTLSLLPGFLKALPSENELFGKSDSLGIQAWYENQFQALDSEIDENRIKAKIPSLNVGYFAQSLEKDFRFQGFHVTAAFPIDQRIEKTNMQRLKVQQNQILNDQWAKVSEIEIHVGQLEYSIQQLQKTLDISESRIIRGQKRLLERVERQYTEGEINFLEFSQIQRMVFQKRNDYIDQIHLYNKKIIQLNYLSPLNQQQ